jgi:transposase
VELYLKVRLAVSEGMSQRQAAKHFNISRDSVAKMRTYSTPPGYQRQSPVRRPKLDAFVSTIDHWLDEDRHVPRKQRHTAKRVFDRLRDECGFTGGYTIIKDYIREREQRRQEVFVPLSHPPGHAQADFGEATVVIGGVEQKARFFVLDLPHSDGCYVESTAKLGAIRPPFAFPR